MPSRLSPYTWTISTLIKTYLRSLTCFLGKRVEKTGHWKFLSPAMSLIWQAGKTLKNQCMESIIDALMPHIHYCRTICFEVLYYIICVIFTFPCLQNPVHLIGVTFEARLTTSNLLPIPKSPVNTSCIPYTNSQTRGNFQSADVCSCI